MDGGWRRAAARAALLASLVLSVGGTARAADPLPGDPVQPPSTEPAKLPPLIRGLLDGPGAPVPLGRVLAFFRKYPPLPLPHGPECAYLLCPPAPKAQEIQFPPPPYEPEGDDCSLVGRRADVEAYAAVLGAIVEGCLAHAEQSHLAAIAARASLDAQVAALPLRPPSTSIESRVFAVLRTLGRGSRERVDRLRGRGEVLFTVWLRNLTVDAEEVCELAHEVYRPIEETCEWLNQVLCLQDDALLDEDQRADFHAALARALEDVVSRLAVVSRRASSFRADLDAFLEGFADAAIDCPLLEDSPDTKARLLAESGFRDYVSGAREEAQKAAGPRAEVLLLFGGRLVVFAVSLPPDVPLPQPVTGQ